MSLRLLILSFIALGLTACAAPEKTAKKSASIPAVEKIQYKQVDKHKLNLHVFKPEGWKASDSRPVIIFFFGGGWVGGSPSQFFPHCEHFAKLGFVAISAEYRIKKKHKTSPFECVKDGKSAIRYLRQHAAELGIDSQRIVASGGSAGGHVACTTGVIKGNEEAGEDSKISSVPNAMILFNPVLDTTAKGYGAEKVKGRETEISPCHQIRKDQPASLILTGKADTTTPYENAERFTRLMKEAGNSCKLIGYDGQKHGFFNARNKDIYKDTLEKSEAFLKEQKILK